MARKEHPRYANTDWPEYEFNEYPMMVYPGSKDGGKTPDRDPTKPGKFRQEAVIVHNAAERAQALGGEAELTETGSKGVSRPTTEADERADLIEKLGVAGVQFDKKWSLVKLQDAWDTHENEKAIV